MWLLLKYPLLYAAVLTLVALGGIMDVEKEKNCFSKVD